MFSDFSFFKDLMPVHSVSIKVTTSVIALASSLLLLVMSLNAKLNIYDDEKVLNFAKGLLEVILSSHYWFESKSSA